MIDVRDVCVSYRDEVVLDRVSFSCQPGQIVALVGENGCGKSTLGRVLAASILPGSGTVLVDGFDPSHDADARMRVRSLVGLVQQDPLDQIVSSVVFDEVAFGPRNIGCDEAEVRRRVASCLSAVGLAGFEGRSTNGLSGGEQQRVAVAGVLAMDPRYIVFDESTAQLDPHARERMRVLYRALAHERGIGVVLITHDLHEIELSDRVIDVGASGAARQAASSEAGLALDDGPCCEGAVRPAACERRLHGAALEVRDISFSYDGHRVLDGASLRVGAGEVVLLRGASGAGKSTFAAVAAGLLLPESGSVSLGGRPVAPMSVGLSLQSPEKQFFLDTVREELAFAPLNAGCDQDEVERRVRAASAMVGLTDDLLGRYPFELSGGQARRVALGSILTTGAGAYILDEPTSGLDASGRVACHRFVRELARSGAAVLVISHDVEEWEPLVDGVAMLDDGVIYREPSITAGSTASVASGSHTSQAPESASEDALRRRARADAHCEDLIPNTRPEGLAGIDARAKIIILMAMTISVLCARTPIAVALWVGALLVLVRASGLTLGAVLRSMRPVMLILLFTVLANLVACDGTGDVALAGPVGLSMAGGMRGLMAVSRIAVLVAISLVMVATTRTSEVGEACVRLMRPLGRLGVPIAQVGAAIEVALRFMPIVSDEIARIRLAQRARGVRFDTGPLVARVRAWGSVFTPLIVGLFRRADRLGDAMAARCFGAHGGRMPEPRALAPRDRRVLLAGVLLSVVLMAVGLALRP